MSAPTQTLPIACCFLRPLREGFVEQDDEPAGIVTIVAVAGALVPGVGFAQGEALGLREVEVGFGDLAAEGGNTGTS